MKEESLLLLSDLQKLINQVVLIDYTIIILGGNSALAKRNRDLLELFYDNNILDSDVILDKKIHVDMPEKNIVDIYMDVLKNNDHYLFDWEADAGATPGSMFAMGTAANMVQIFNGVLDWDGASWCQLINSFSMDSSSYDAKYSESFAKMFCTYSDEELSQDVDAMKEKLKPFDAGEWISDSMKDIDDLYDDKIGDLSRATADLKKKVVAENKASMIAFNKSYQELDELYSKTDTFNHLTNVLDDFYSIVEIAGDASEFQNQDKFAVKSLDTFIKNCHNINIQ